MSLSENAGREDGQIRPHWPNRHAAESRGCRNILIYNGKGRLALVVDFPNKTIICSCPASWSPTSKGIGVNFWKVLAGAATGVAVVVALPVAGAVGTVTMAGAAVGAAAGAAVGAVADALDDSEDQAVKRGEERERARNAELLARVQSYLEHTKDFVNFGDQLVAMFAMGIACANCDGEIHPDEKRDIEDSIAGFSSSGLPAVTKESINKLWEAPPNIKTAFELAKSAGVGFSVLDDIIDLVMMADGRVHPRERAFRSAWTKLKAA